MRLLRNLGTVLLAGALCGPVEAGMLLSAAPTGGGGGGPTGTCSQSTAFFSRVWALPATLDGTVTPSAGHVGAYDKMICGLVSDANTPWTLADVLRIYATNAATGSAQAVAMLNLKSASFTGTASSAASSAFTADAGYLGSNASATDVHVDTGFNPTTAGGNYTQNAASLGAWVMTNNAASGTGGTVLGSTNTAFTQTSQLDVWVAGGFADFYLNVNATSSPPQYSGVGSSKGGWFGNRSAANAVQGYFNGSALTLTTGAAATSVAIPNLNIYSLATNENGTAAGGTPNQVGAIWIGGSLTAAQALALHNWVCGYLHTVNPTAITTCP